MTESVDVLIVGAGIAGLAHAWQAARRGRRVAVVERSPFAQGASIRNFGMIWPIGQSPENVDVALRSRELWLEAATGARLWARPCGSLHLARADDEAAVLEEFAAGASAAGYRCSLLTPDEAARRSRVVRPEGLKAALLSETEVNIDPRQAIAAIPAWLRERFGVSFHFGVMIGRVGAGLAHATDGRNWRFERAVVCGGADVQALYPDLGARHAVRGVKLQMLATAPQPIELGPMLAGGLTLQHYPAFAHCPTLPLLRRRFAEELPDYNAHGIHVMFSQSRAGEFVIGDSHHYDAEITPFDSAEVERLILDYARSLADAPTWHVARRWNGVYAKHATLPVVHESPLPGVEVIAATGGTGMTMSFGLAERFWKEWERD